MPLTIDVSTNEIKRIAAMAEPVLRNVYITQCYWELSTVFAARMGAYSNWCTLATWASKQAGQTIRREDLHRTLEAGLQNEPEIEAALLVVIAAAKRLGAQQTFDQLHNSALGSMLQATTDRASNAVSRGNQKVFEEIGFEFARFIANCFSDSSFNKSNINSFCTQLKPGLPPAGQNYLSKAFAFYYDAVFEKDSKKKAELCLLANLQIGLHEQTRLQPEIAEALNASMPEMENIKKRLLNEITGSIPLHTKFSLFFSNLLNKTGLLEKPIESLLQRIQHHIRILLTAHLMTLTIPPGKRLHLGSDLGMPYPTDLAQLQNKDLLALLKEVDPTPNSVSQSGATDWANLAERMHFITELFRCCHESKELLDPPFTVAQTNNLKHGIAPVGNL